MNICSVPELSGCIHEYLQVSASKSVQRFNFKYGHSSDPAYWPMPVKHLRRKMTTAEPPRHVCPLMTKHSPPLSLKKGSSQILWGLQHSLFLQKPVLFTNPYWTESFQSSSMECDEPCCDKSRIGQWNILVKRRNMRPNRRVTKQKIPKMDGLAYFTCAIPILLSNLTNRLIALGVWWPLMEWSCQATYLP